MNKKINFKFQNSFIKKDLIQNNQNLEEINN